MFPYPAIGRNKHSVKPYYSYNADPLGYLNKLKPHFFINYGADILNLLKHIYWKKAKSPLLVCIFQYETNYINTSPL